MLRGIFKLAVIFNLIVSNVFIACQRSSDSNRQRLVIFAGAASKLPAEKVIKLFEKKTGIKVDANFGGSGYMLSQMILGKRGDIYFPGSSDYMEKAKRQGQVIAETEKIIVYLPEIGITHSCLPASRGQAGGIYTLKWLTQRQCLWGKPFSCGYISCARYQCFAGESPKNRKSEGPGLCGRVCSGNNRKILFGP
jgi:hypothetical protein